jgi:hypothetical protein
MTGTTSISTATETRAVGALLTAFASSFIRPEWLIPPADLDRAPVLPSGARPSWKRGIWA